MKKFRCGVSVSRRGFWGAITLAPLAIMASGLQNTWAQQTYPARPITLIVPWTAGGATDVVLRAMAMSASSKLGQPIIVENKPGATGTLGPSRMAATAKPDGYTISQIPMGVFRMPLLQTVTYDPAKDFTYIIQLTGYTQGITTLPNARWNSMKELIEYAREHPDEVTYGTGGHGSSPHITMEEISRKTGARLRHIPFKSGAEALNAAMGGHVDFFAGEAVWAPHVKAGTMKLLATWSPARPPAWPDVPTLREQGIDVVSTAPYGLAGPANMDPAVIKKLHDAFKATLDDSEVKEKMALFAQESAYLDSAQYGSYASGQLKAQTELLGGLGLLPERK